jgi:hypothetical protein
MSEPPDRPESGWDPPTDRASGQQPPSGGGSWPAPGQQPPSGGGSWPAPGQQPPSGGGSWPAPGQQPPPAGEPWDQHPPHVPGVASRPEGSADVTLPAWLGTDWLLALRVVLVGMLLLLLAGAALTLVDVLRLIAGPGLSAVDWTGVAVGPLVAVLGWSGGAAGAPLLVTGVVYSFFAYRWAARRAEAQFVQTGQDRARLFAFAPKIGILAAAVLLTVGILLNSFGESLVFRTSGIFGLFGAVDLTSMVFFTLFVGSLAGLFATLSATSTSLPAALGIRGAMPALVRSGVAGARRVVLVGGLGLLVLYTLGTLLDSLSQSGTGFGQVLSILLSQLVGILYRGIDLAVLLLLGTTKFLHEGGFVWSGIGGPSPWMWFAIPILLGAYVAGGMATARMANPSTQLGAVKAAALVGPAVAAVALLVAIGWAGQPNINDIIPIAILLPSLWGAVAVGGAWLWANQQGLPSGTTTHAGGAPAGPGVPVPPATSQGTYPPPSGGQHWTAPGAPGWSPPAAGAQPSQLHPAGGADGPARPQAGPPAAAIGSEPTRTWSDPPSAAGSWAPPSGEPASADTGDRSTPAQGTAAQAGSDVPASDRLATDERPADDWNEPAPAAEEVDHSGPPSAAGSDEEQPTPERSGHGTPGAGPWAAPSGVPVDPGAESSSPPSPGADGADRATATSSPRFAEASGSDDSSDPASSRPALEPEAGPTTDPPLAPSPAAASGQEPGWPAPPSAPQAPADWPAPPSAPQAPADWPAPPSAPQAPADWPAPPERSQPPAQPRPPADDTIDLGALPPPDPTRRSRD